MRHNDDLDRNKGSWGYPDVVTDAIVSYIVTLCGQGNEKYDQSFMNTCLTQGCDLCVQDKSVMNTSLVPRMRPLCSISR